MCNNVFDKRTTKNRSESDSGRKTAVPPEFPKKLLRTLFSCNGKSRPRLLRSSVQADAPRGYSKVRIAPGLHRPPGLCARSAFYLSLSTQNIQIRLYLIHFGWICQGQIGRFGTVSGKIPQKRGLIFSAPSGRIQSAAQFFSGGRAASK